MFDNQGLRELSSAEIVASVRAGVIVNDTGPDGETLSTTQYSSHVDGSRYDETDVDAIIRATELMDALTVLSLDTENPPHPAGLVLRKTVIDGSLDLNYLTLDFPLRFDGCEFTGWINLDFASLSALTLDSCAFEVQRDYLSFGAIGGHSVTVENALRLTRVRGLKQLFLLDSTIGSLDLYGSAISDIAETGYGFRTVLDGTSIERFGVDTDLMDATEGPLKMAPLGSPTRITVGSLQTGGGSAKRVSIDPKRLAGWIIAGGTGEKQKTLYSRQVWEEFAGALDRDAMDKESTQLRILGLRFGRSKKPAFARFWDWIVDVTIGYGYANHRAFLLWLGLLILAIATTSIASICGLLPSVGHDLTNPGAILLYSLAVVLSPVGTSGPEDWFFGGAPVALALVLSAIKIASLVLLGLFLSGVTGIISKK